jgi:acylphosphatase
MKCVRCVVSGRVQGVWYRKSAQKKAEALAITGYAHNLSDGRVEVLAYGEEHALEALLDWLWQGPAHAQVDDVQCETVAHITPLPDKFITG